MIELLVVISIIALLIGILLPVLGRAREAGNAARCLSNLRQLGFTTGAYRNDNRQHFPQPRFDPDISTESSQNSAVWYNALDYYVGNSVVSGSAGDRNDNSYKQDPVWNDLPRTVNGGTLLEDDDVRTLKMNAFFGHGNGTTPPGGPGFRFFRVTEVPLPGQTVLYGDGRAFDTVAVNTGAVDVGNSRGFGMIPVLVGLRHEGGANLAKVDGSAAHEINAVRTTTGSNQYQGWFNDDDATIENRPQSTFNFRPEDFD